MRHCPNMMVCHKKMKIVLIVLIARGDWEVYNIEIGGNTHIVIGKFPNEHSWTNPC